MELIIWFIILVAIILVLQFIKSLLWELIDRFIYRTADKIENFFKKKD